MNLLPFEIYLSPLDIEEYGVIYEIPNYFSEEELDYITHQISENYTPIDSEIYPNWSMGKSLSEKTKILGTHYKRIVDHSKSLQNKCTYTCDYESNKDYTVMRIKERIQGSPIGMRRYPIHNDGGKSLTCIIPLCPVKSVPTTFNGNSRTEERGVDLGWKVNHAYMFIPNNTYSYHSYGGDMENDRWIANINFYTEKQLSNRFEDSVEWLNESDLGKLCIYDSNRPYEF